MFGNRNKFKNNRETASSPAETESQNAWQTAMAGIEPFDQHRIEQPTEEQKPQTESVVEKETAEEAPLSPEIIRDVDRLNAQLERMGANPDIIHNSAFSRFLEDRIFSYQIKEANQHNLALDTSDDHRLQFSGNVRNHEARDYSRSEIGLSVSDNGNIVLAAGHARNQYIGHGSVEDLTNAYEENIIRPLENGGFEVFNDEVVDAAISEQKIGDGKGARLEYVGFTDYSTNHYQYDSDGMEIFREICEYPTTRLDSERGSTHESLLKLKFSLSDIRDGLPKTVRTIELSQQRSLVREGHLREQTRLRYHRNADGLTMRVEGTVEDRKVDRNIHINTQYGNADLIPSNGVRDLLEEEDSHSE